MKQENYLNPYLAGFLLGLLLTGTVYITGRGLGASGGVKAGVTAAVAAIAPEHAKQNEFYAASLEPAKSPLKAWLVFELIGVVIGAFVSGLISSRLTWETEHPPQVTVRRRLFFALLGGALFGIGSQFARGCTSGSALSGMAVMSVGGMITMAAIFGAAYAVAYFFRKLWI